MPILPTASRGFSPFLLAGALALSSGPPIAAEVVARVGDVQLDRAELEARLATPLLQLDQQRADLLEKGLDAWVDEQLLAGLADRRGTDPEAFVAALEVPEVTSGEVSAWIEQNRSRIGRPVDAEVREAVLRHLESQKRQEALDDELEKAARSMTVETRLEPWRVSIANDGAPRRGPASAPVELTVFSDFECPWCRRLVPALEEVEERFGENVTIVFRQYPLTSIHPRAEGAALASMCAADQGAFWSYHDALFADPSNLEVGRLPVLAAEAGLDVATWEACRTAPETSDRLASETSEGRALGVSSTPAVYVNGRPVRFTRDSTPSAQLGEVVDDELGRRVASET